MAAPTSQNEVTARKLSDTISGLWGKIKDTFSKKAEGVYYVAGTTSYANWAASTAYAVGDERVYSGKAYSCKTAHTSGTSWDSSKWTALATPILKGSITGITALTTGMKIAYKLPITGGTSSTYLNINNLGNVYIKRNNGNTTTQLGANTVVFLAYDGSAWQWADYDSNTNNWVTTMGAYCDTAAATAAKVATSTNTVLTAGMSFLIRIVNANTSAGKLTLNINSQGAKDIWINGAVSSSSNYTLPAGEHWCHYDGSVFQIWTDGTAHFKQLKLTNKLTDANISSAATWNAKQDALTTQTAYSAKGTATKVPQITTNTLGQVTGITEVTITGVTPASHAHGNIANGGTLTDTAAAAAGNDYVVIRDADNSKIQTSTIKGTDVADAVTKKHSHSTLTLSTTAQAYDGTHTLVLPSTDPYTSARTPSSHTHGNIQNGGTLQTDDVTIASGDKLVITDSSNSSKVARASISFDGSTATKALTQKGTWETFNNYSHPTTTAADAAAVKVGKDGLGHVVLGSALGKSDVGLGSVVNTGDSATPVSGGTTKFTTGGAYTELAKKADLASPTFTGTPKAPTAAAGTDSTQIATTAFVKTATTNLLAEADAMIYKGTVAGGSTGSYGALTPAADKGHTYKVTTAGKIDGVAVEVGDMLICNTDSTAAATSSNYATVAANWDFVQTNLDGVVIGPSSVTSGTVAAFDGTTGKLLKALTASQVKSAAGLGSVVNTGDSATPTSGGTTKFTTGGAYTELAKKVDVANVSLDDQTTTILAQVQAMAASGIHYRRFYTSGDSGAANISDKPVSGNAGFVCEVVCNRYGSSSDWRYQVTCWVQADTNPYVAAVTHSTTSISWARLNTNTTYSFDGTYNASTNKAATVSTVTNAIGALDGTISGSAGSGKTLTAFSQTDGKVSATFGNISITKSQVSDFSHTHSELIDWNNGSQFIGIGWAKNSISNVKTGNTYQYTGAIDWTNNNNITSRFLASMVSQNVNGVVTAIIKEVDANNVTVGNASNAANSEKWGNYNISVGTVSSATNTISFMFS